VINAPPLQQQIINSPPLYFANRNNNPELFQSAPVQPYLPPGPGPTQAVHPTPTTTSPKGYGLPQHQDNRQYATQNSAPLGQVSPGMSLKYSQSFQGNQMYPVGRLAPQSSGELNQHAGLVGMTKNNLTTSVQGAAANRTFHLNSPTSRSPSRHMRVSYIDSWSAHNPNSSSPAHVPTRGCSARTQSRTNHSSLSETPTTSCLLMICPGCKLMGVVTCITVIQVGIMIMFHVLPHFYPQWSFDRLVDASALIGNKVMFESEFYRLPASMFVHGSWPQLLVNVFMQQQLGNLLSARFDSCLWLQVWIFCGIFGSLFGCIVQPTAVFVSVTAANLGPTGFHLSEVLLIMPQLQTLDLRRKAVISIVIAILQVGILSSFQKALPISNVVAFALGNCIGIMYHRKGADLPKWYGKARGFSLFFVLAMVFATTTRFFVQRFYHF